MWCINTLFGSFCRALCSVRSTYKDVLGRTSRARGTQRVTPHPRPVQSGASAPATPGVSGPTPPGTLERSQPPQHRARDPTAHTLSSGPRGPAPPRAPCRGAGLHLPCCILFCRVSPNTHSSPLLRRDCQGPCSLGPSCRACLHLLGGAHVGPSCHMSLGAGVSNHLAGLGPAFLSSCTGDIHVPTSGFSPACQRFISATLVGEEGVTCILKF